MLMAATATIFRKPDMDFGHLTFRATAIDLVIGRIYAQSLVVQNVGE
jgi:hypothetical protein